MNWIRTTCLLVAIAAGFLVPISVYAQTTTQQQINVLTQLVQKLETQIALLETPPASAPAPTLSVASVSSTGNYCTNPTNECQYAVLISSPLKGKTTPLCRGVMTYCPHR